MLRVPRCICKLRVYLEWVRITCLWGIILVIKVVNHFFNFYGIFWRELAILNESSEIGITRSIDIDRKSGERIGFRVFVVMLVNLLIFISTGLLRA